MFSKHDDALGLPVGPDRLLFAAMILFVLFDPRLRLSRLRIGSFHGFAAATVAWAGLSALAFGSIFTTLGFFAWLDRLVVPYALFLLAPVLLERAEDRLLLLKVLTCIGLYLGVTAIAEMVGPHAIVFPRYILDRSIGSQYGRARGPFAESEANGLTLLASGYCAMGLARSAPTVLWRRLGTGTAVVTLLGALLTLTRSIWLGAVVGLVLVIVAEPRVRRPLSALVALTAVLAAIVLVSSPTLSDSVYNRANSSRPLEDRKNTNAAAVRAIVEHPLTGVGWVKFVDVAGTYVRQADQYPITTTDIEIHNVVLSRAAELGIPGAALWLSTVFLGPVSALWRRPGDASGRIWWFVLLGTFSAWVIPVVTSPLPYPLPNNLLWLFAGVVATPRLLRPSGPRTGSRTADGVEGAR